MLGRLVIALLVVCSAAAVVWQRQRTEADDLSATLADSRATDAEKHAAELEKKLQETELHAAEAEAKAALFQAKADAAEAQRLAEIEAADVHIESFAWVGLGRDVVGARDPGPDGRPDGHFALSVQNAGYVIRIQLHANPMGTSGASWDTLDPSRGMLGVLKNGALLNGGGRGAFAVPTKEGVTKLDLAANESGYFVAGMPYTVEVTLSSGRVLQRTATAPMR